jgi:hypothetical protein
LAGYSHWSEGTVGVSHIPVSIGLAATIPNPAFSIKPWIAPRLDATRSLGKTDTHFGISGGIDLSMLSGLSLRAAYDRVSVNGGSPAILSFGIGYSM